MYEVKSGTKTVGQVIRHGLMRPFAMFWHERIIQILSGAFLGLRDEVGLIAAPDRKSVV